MKKFRITVYIERVKIHFETVANSAKEARRNWREKNPDNWTACLVTRPLHD